MPCQAVAIPYLEVVAVMVDLPIVPACSAGIYRNPAKRAPDASRLAPVETDLFKLFAARDVFSSNALQGLAMQT